MKTTTTIRDLPWDIVQKIDEVHTYKKQKAVLNEEYNPEQEHPECKRLKVETTECSVYALCKALNGWQGLHSKRGDPTERRGLVSHAQIPFFVFREGAIPDLYKLETISPYSDIIRHISFDNYTMTTVTVQDPRNSSWLVKGAQPVEVSVWMLGEHFDDPLHLLETRTSVKNGRCGCMAAVMGGVSGWRLCKRKAARPFSTECNKRELLCTQHMKTLYELD